MLIKIILAALLCCSLAHADEWRQAAGPHGDWRVKSKVSPPSSWSVRRQKNITWKTALPEGGQSGIIISRGRIFLSIMKPVLEVRDSRDLMSSDIECLCLDEKTGEILWRRELKGSLKSEMMSGFSDSSSPSPVSDGKNVWFCNASGALACFDFDGKLIWQHEWQPIASLNGVDFPFNKQFEPFIYDNIIVNMEPERQQNTGRNYGWNYLYAYDKNTGRLLWVSEDAMTHYNTPACGTLSNGKAAVLIGRGARP